MYMNTLGILYSDDFTRAVYPQVGKTLVYTQMLSIRARDAGRFLQVKRQALSKIAQIQHHHLSRLSLNHLYFL